MRRTLASFVIGGLTAISSAQTSLIEFESWEISGTALFTGEVLNISPFAPPSVDELISWQPVLDEAGMSPAVGTEIVRDLNHSSDYYTASRDFVSRASTNRFGTNPDELYFYMREVHDLRASGNFIAMSGSTRTILNSAGVFWFRVNDWTRLSIGQGANNAYQFSGTHAAPTDTYRLMRLRGPYVDGFDEMLVFESVQALNEAPTVSGQGTRILPPGLYRLRGHVYSELAFTRANNTSLSYMNGNWATGCNWPFEAAGVPQTEQQYMADIDGDSDLDLDDLLAWFAAPVDANRDGTVDAAPYGDDARMLALLLNTTGQLGADCNGNLFPDAYDIAVGSMAGGSDDANANTIPDECESCTGDIADDFGTLNGGDGMVSFGDFLALLGLIGPCGGGTTNSDCTGDIADDFGTVGNEDGQVSFGDFLALLGLIGPCP